MLFHHFHERCSTTHLLHAPTPQNERSKTTLLDSTAFAFVSDWNSELNKLCVDRTYRHRL